MAGCRTHGRQLSRGPRGEAAPTGCRGIRSELKTAIMSSSAASASSSRFDAMFNQDSSKPVSCVDDARESDEFGADRCLVRSLGRDGRRLQCVFLLLHKLACIVL